MRLPSTSPYGEGRQRTDDDFEELFEDAPCGYLTTTPDGVITRVNRTFERMIGRGRDALVGTALVDRFTASAQLFYEARYTMVLSLAGEVRDVTLSLERADGSELPAILHAVVVPGDDGRPRGIRTAVFDATERQDYERQLLSARRAAEASAARVHVLQDASSAFATVTSAKELADALAASAGPALLASNVGVLLAEGGEQLEMVTGDDTVHELLGAGVLDLVEQAIGSGEIVSISNLDQAATIMPGLDDALHAQRLTSLSIAPMRRGERASGAVICAFGRDRTFDDDTREILAALSRQAAQVLRRVRLQEELEHRALHDQLTGLANRKLLQERLEAAIANAERGGRPISVVFVDLDGFKTINDELGHRPGDEVLVEVAGRLRRAARAGDPVARYGGDEFVVVCEDADPGDATTIAERFREEVRRPLDTVPPAYAVAASVGVAVWQPGSAAKPSADLLIRIADQAMYASKHAGRDRVTTVII